MLYTFRFGYNRAYHATGPEQIADLPGVAEYTPGRGLGGLAIGGLTAGGPGATGARNSLKNHYQFSTQASYVRAKSTFEFGAQGQEIRFNENHPSVSSGNWEFDGLRQFMLGQPTRFEGILPDDATGMLAIGLVLDITSQKNWRNAYWGVYFRDRIRWTSNLSLDWLNRPGAHGADGGQRPGVQPPHHQHHRSVQLRPGRYSQRREQAL